MTGSQQWGYNSIELNSELLWRLGKGMNSATAPFEFQFTSTDGLRIACSRWDSRGPCRGIVQIGHGLGEHIGRYLGLIEVLVGAGLVVYGNDHRGHGRTALSSKHFGDFGDGGFKLLVEDMLRLSAIAKEENPEKPFILLAHSMGSFAAQEYVLDHSYSIDGLALSGSGALDGLVRLAKSAPPGEDNILNAPFAPGAYTFRLVEPRSRCGGRVHERPTVFRSPPARGQ